MRHEIELSRKIKPIQGGSFTFRTLNPPVGRIDRRDSTLDKLITVTLPAISGEHHTIVPSMEVEL